MAYDLLFPFLPKFTAHVLRCVGLAQKCSVCGVQVLVLSRSQPEKREAS